MFKKSSLLIGLVFMMQQQIFAFTVINQTDSKREIELREFDEMGASNNWNKAHQRASHLLTLEPKSSKTITLSESCPTLLVDVIEKTKKRKGLKSKVSITRQTTRYGAYDYAGERANLLTDSWGLVIHEPLEDTSSASSFSRDPMESYTRRQNLEQGYGIKCLHPRLLKKVTPVSGLPEELQ